METRLSASGFFIQLNGAPIIRQSKAQIAVAKSTAEPEFVAASLCSDYVMYVRQLLYELGRPQIEPTTMFIDNHAALAMIINPNPVHSKIKHIDIQFMSIRERITTKQIVCKYINSKENPANILMKSIAREQFQLLRNNLGLKESSKTYQ